METGMIIEKRELFFLLSCRGCQNCPSVFKPDDRGRAEEILRSLFEKKWIANTGRRFQVEHRLAEAVSCLAEAEKLLCLYHGNRKRELLYLYPGDRLLAVQESFLRKNALRLLHLDREALQCFLEEQGFLGSDPEWEPLPYMDGSMDLLPEKLLKRSDLAAYPWIWLIVEETKRQTAQTLERIGVVRMGFQEVIVTEDTEKGTIQREPYTAKRLTEKLLRRLSDSPKGV